MCKQAGISGLRTNYSLGVTTATRLHQSGCVDEQQIMDRTGHRNVEAVRRYKRSSTEQLEQVSDILNTGKKRLYRVSPLIEVEGNITHNSVSLEYTGHRTAPFFNLSSCGSNNYSQK